MERTSVTVSAVTRLFAFAELFEAKRGSKVSKRIVINPILETTANADT